MYHIDDRNDGVLLSIFLFIRDEEEDHKSHIKHEANNHHGSFIFSPYSISYLSIYNSRERWLWTLSKNQFCDKNLDFANMWNQISLWP